VSAVIAHFSLPVAWHDSHAAKKAYIRWSHTCKAYGVTDIALIDVDSLAYEFGDAEINLTVVSTLDEALAVFPSHNPVYVEEGGTDIASFDYPSSPVFIYGSDFGLLPRADLSLQTIIPLTADVANGIVLAHWRSAVGT